jgi:hypothetical protein
MLIQKVQQLLARIKIQPQVAEDILAANPQIAACISTVSNLVKYLQHIVEKHDKNREPSDTQPSDTQPSDTQPSDTQPSSPPTWETNDCATLSFHFDATVKKVLIDFLQHIEEEETDEDFTPSRVVSSSSFASDVTGSA